jgi:hypothetical protein
MKADLTAVSDAVTHECSSFGAPTPVYLRASITGTFTATLSLQVKDTHSDDAEYVTLTTFTTATPEHIRQVVGKLKYRLKVDDITSGTATAELVSSL